MGNKVVYEGFVSFDTSSIPDTDTIDSATLSLTAATDASYTDFTIEARTKDWGASLTSVDWVAGADLSGLALLASYATASGWVGTTTYAFTSESAFRSAVSKTGTTYVMVSSSRTRVGNEPSGDEYVSTYSANQSGTTYDPKLVVTHTAAPAPSVTGVVPVRGPMTGGTSVVITGTEFSGVTAVDFENNGDWSLPAASFNVDSATQITAVSPAAYEPVTVDIRVTAAGGQSPTGAGDEFTYDEVPIPHVGAPSLPGALYGEMTVRRTRRQKGW
jgi:hypothetical protein